MNFDINGNPPSAEAIATEHEHLQAQQKSVKIRDTVTTFFLIVVVSIILGALVYFASENARNAIITVTVIPLIGAVLMSTGIVTDAGFRSAAHQIITLNHQIFALEPVSDDNQDDINTLKGKYEQVAEYVDNVQNSGRSLVNGELAMFWEWDASTMAKTARGRDYMEKAKHSVDSDEGEDEPQFEI